MRRYAAGEQSAARALTLRHAPRLMALARRMLGDATEAEDVTQEAMLRLWKQAPDWQAGLARIDTWLYRVARNLCIDRLRRRREYISDTLAELPDARPGALAGLEHRDRAAALQAVLAALPDRQRLAVTLRHLHELSNPAIAAVLDTSVEAVESLLLRGRRELAAQVAPRRAELGLADDAVLAPFFAAERRDLDATLSPDLLAAILADAAAVNAGRARPDWRAWFRGVLEPIGGWPSAAALGTCAVLGFGAGIGGLGSVLTEPFYAFDVDGLDSAAAPVDAFFDLAVEG